MYRSLLERGLSRVWVLESKGGTVVDARSGKKGVKMSYDAFKGRPVGHLPIGEALRKQDMIAEKLKSGT